MQISGAVLLLKAVDPSITTVILINFNNGFKQSDLRRS
jgi:hypothetical protein